jgi:DNA-binding CsgD family transcriptional regulator/PAS domain-containing protein
MQSCQATDGVERPDEAFLRLVDLIYSAAEDPQGWRAVYEQIAAALGAKSIHMLALNKATGTLSFSDGLNLPVEGELAYMHRYLGMDPRMPLAISAGDGAWSHFPEMLPAGIDAETHPLYQEFLLPYDRRYNSQCNLVDTPEATIVFSVLNGEAEGPLSPDKRAFLERLKPHLQRACRMGLRTFLYSSQALVGHLLVNRLRQPVLLMTTDGVVLHSNEAAQDLLKATRLVQVVDSRLHLPHLQLAALLRTCREAEQRLKASGGDADPVSASRFHTLRIASGEESVYAFHATLSPQREMGAFGLRPVVMLLFYHPASAPAIDASLLYAMFGLSPAECRIATQLAEGRTLKEIASANGTRHDTVRKQLQSIYQKTSTNRQPELVKLLLNLPQGAVHDFPAGASAPDFAV